MDERALTELLECSVCLEQLDATSKVLQCQHTFCRRCLEEIMATKNELRCPECRMLVELRVEDLPSNILLIRLLEGLKNCKAGITTGQSASPSANSSPSHTTPSSPGGSAAGGGGGGGSRTSPIHKQIVNTSQPCSKALYNYDAKEPGDLTFKKGDVILLRRQVDENWYHGELNNQLGFFPATYVQVITPLPQEVPKCKALYDFVISDKNEKDCLTFQKDEILTVIRRVDDNWAEGKLGERIGIFPISFVEMNDSAKWLINNQTQINARPNAVATPSHQSNSGNNQHNTSGSSPIHLITSSTSSSSSNNQQHHNNTPNHTSSSTSANSGSSSSNNNDSNNIILSSVSGGSPPGGSGSGSAHNITSSSSSSSREPHSSSSSHSTPLNPVAAGHGVLSNPSVAAVQRAAGQKRHSLTCIGSQKISSAHAAQHQRHSMELSATSLSLVAPLLSSAPASVTSSPAHKASAGCTSSGDVGSGSGVSSASAAAAAAAVAASGHMPPNGLVLYVALYNYKPQKDDEVELRKGDYYTVSEKCQDGWFKGTCLRTGNFGVFPGNYVQLVKISSKQTSSSVSRGAAPGAVAVGLMSNSSPSSSSCSSSSQQQPTSTSTGTTSSGSPARQSPQVAKVQQHATVSRAHSFPKTSPLAGVDYQVNRGQHPQQSQQGSSSNSSSRQGTPSHTSRSANATSSAANNGSSSSCSRNGPDLIMGTPTRVPRTGNVLPSSTSGTPCSSTHSSPAHHTPSSRNLPHQYSNGVISASVGVSPSSSSGASGDSSRKSSSHHHSSSSSSHGHSRGSPRSGRKSERSKHSGGTSVERMASIKHGSAAVAAASGASSAGHHRSHSAEVPPHAPARSASTALHSMATNTTLTPPNVVVGAIGGNPPPPPPVPREKEKKKEKDRLGLMKRLTKSKKSKSPPPDPSDGATSSDAATAHQRTGSCPSSSLEGAIAGVTPNHRKTSSLDASSSSACKVSRNKSLLRERCRCIVPYPPQSDIELELKVGDIVFVHKRREDGWYKGTLQRTGKTGLFPGSFVESF